MLRLLQENNFFALLVFLFASLHSCYFIPPSIGDFQPKLQLARTIPARV